MHIFNPREGREVDLWAQGQSSLQGKFQDSQGYTEKTCLKKKNKSTKPLLSWYQNRIRIQQKKKLQTNFSSEPNAFILNEILANQIKKNRT